MLSIVVIISFTFGFFRELRSQSCELSGVWNYENNLTQKLNFVKISSVAYRISCLASSGCPVPYDWYGIGIPDMQKVPNFTEAVATFDSKSPYELVVSFYKQGVFINAESAIVSANCDIFMWQFYLAYVYPQVRPSWCGPRNPTCKYDPSKYWSGGKVHLMEISHSDIGWLGFQNDLEIDSDYITMALDLIRQNPGFKWQSECILFLRAWLNFFPNREWEILQRMKDGSFDIGGTYTEGFESTMLGEILVRQMYSGRKWFVEKFPGVDSAVVAWHQDGPLRAIQMPQIYAKSGLRYLKFSRFSDRIFHWASPDGSRLLAFGEVHYCEGAKIQGIFTVADTVKRMARWEAKYRTMGVPGGLDYPLTQGCDYAPPTYIDPYYLQDWNKSSQSNTSIGYSTIKEFLDNLTRSFDASKIPTLVGERPNLWIYENTPTHHWMFNNYREAGRILPMAESFSSFCAILSSSWTGYPEAMFSEIWRNLTMNDHGFGHENVPKNSSIPKWIVNEKSPDFWDEVYNEKFMLSRVQGEVLLANALKCIVSKISFAGAVANAESSFFVLFNGLSWTRTQVVEIDGNSFNGKFKPGDDLVILGKENNPILPQWKDDKLLFVASNVPSYGYSTFQVKRILSAEGNAKTLREKARRKSLENQLRPQSIWNTPYTNAFFRITPGRGGIASLYDLQSNQELFDTTHYMAGEWMFLQYTGMGASETREIPHPWVNQTYFQRLGNTSSNPIWRFVSDGGVFARFETDPVVTNHSIVSLELKAYHHVKRIDLRVSIKKWDGFFGGCNRIVFPLNTKSRRLSYSVPFGVVRVGTDENEHSVHDTWNNNPGVNYDSFERGWRLRPREIQDWIAAEFSDTFGLTISSPVGAWDWIDVTGKYSELAPVLSPEMLTHTNSNQGPFLPEIGDHYFDFSIFSGKGNWQTRLRDAVGVNNPMPHVLVPQEQLRSVQSTLPLSASFLSVGGNLENIWVTAVKKEDGDKKSKLIVRLFDTFGIDSNISLSVNIGRPRNFMSTNIIEQPFSPIRPVNVSSFEISHWSIETYSLDIN